MPQNNGREEFFLIGSNGNALDPQGRLVIAGWASRKIGRVDLKTGRRDVLADRYDGKRLGGPNDIPEGKKLGFIRSPELVANLTFGDADLKTLYVAARMALYKIRVNVTGIPGR